ncbi:MAG TPA: DUF6575 domain-containing protein [Thermoanaerobaculia bacterium]|nr:DUF6575 domain-containing protein [Thermoanaerobaculia bacterium]
MSSELRAIPLRRLPVDLEHVRDLEEFDGPLLSEFRTSDGDTFLYYWCDCSEQSNRWLVVRTPRQDLFRYLVGRVSLRSLIRYCRDGFLYMVDLDGDATVLSAWFVYAENIPENYLPGPESILQPGSGIEPGFQDVSVDQKWDYEQVSAYPRKYLQAYAFHTAFGPGGNPETLKVDYRLTRGWIFHTLFERMRTNAPPARRASLEAVAFASPGYLRFRVDSVIAAGLRDSVVQYLDHREGLRQMIEELRAWVNRHYDLEEGAVRQLIRDASESVGIDGSALLRHIDTIEHAGKVLISYLARLEYLATNQEDHTAMLVGLPVDNE